MLSQDLNQVSSCLQCHIPPYRWQLNVHMMVGHLGRLRTHNRTSSDFYGASASIICEHTVWYLGRDLIKLALKLLNVCVWRTLPTSHVMHIEVSTSCVTRCSLFRAIRFDLLLVKQVNSELYA